MSKPSRCPAIYAGLLGGFGVAALPTTAQALASSGVSSTASDVLGALAPFAIGCGAGAVVSAGIVFVAGRVARSQHGGTHEDPSARESGEVPKRASLDSAAHVAAPESARAPRHARPRDWESTGNIRVAQVCDTSQLQSRHAARPAAQPAAQSAASHAAQPAASHAAQPAAKSSNPYMASAHANHGSAHGAASHHEHLASRLAERAKDAKLAFSNRVDHDKMDGLPVIERADGSVGDVGTSWWDDALDHDSKTGLSRGQSSPQNMADILPGLSVDQTVLPGADLDPYADVVFEHGVVVNPEIAGEARIAQDRASTISSRLSSIDDSVFPEERSWTDAQEDSWESALTALDEKVAQAERAPGVVMEYADDDADGSLEEPDGLDEDTSFIPFRVPAGRPEVTDTESYVDYLIDDEFSRNSSHSVRANAREYLHVIEGGTAVQGKRSTRVMPRRARPDHVPAHFSEADLIELGYEDEPMAQQA